MRRGFTLLELLVVIAIIGLLSSVVLASVNSARAKARDTLRLQHIQQIKNALELYRTANGAYPSSLGCGGVAPNNAWCNTNNPASYTNWQTMMQPYIQLPHDPSETPSGTWANDASPAGYSYAYYSNNTAALNGCAGGQYYWLIYNREIYPGTHGGITMCDGFTQTYTNSNVQNTGVGR